MFKSTSNILKVRNSTLTGLVRNDTTLSTLYKSFHKLNSTVKYVPRKNFSSIRGVFTDYKPLESSVKKQEVQDSKVELAQYKADLVQNINRAILASSTYLTNGNLSRLVYAIKVSKVQLNYYDSLLIMRLSKKYEPVTILLQNYDTIFKKAEAELIEALSDANLRQELYQNGDLYKLLIFVTEGLQSSSMNLSRDNQQSKDIQTTKNFIVNKENLNINIVKYVTFSYLYLNNKTYTQASQPTLITILKLFLLGIKEQDILAHIPDSIQDNDFKLSTEQTRFFQTIINMICYILHETKDTKFIEPHIHLFLDFYTRLCYITEIDPKLAPRVLDLVNNYRESFQIIPTAEYGELVLFLATVITKNMFTYPCDKFTRLFFMLTRLSLWMFKQSSYQEFLINSAEYITRHKHEFTTEQLKSNLYALGFNTVLTPELQKFYSELLDITDIKDKKNYHRYTVYLKNLMLNTLGCYALKDGEQLDGIIQYILHDVRMYDERSQFYDYTSFTKIAMSLRRMDYLDEDFWNILFNSIPRSFASHKDSTYDLYFIFKTFELFTNGNDSEGKYKNISNMIENFSKNYPELYQQIINNTPKELVKSVSEVQRPPTGLEIKMKHLLQKMCLEFEAEHTCKLYFRD